MNRKTAEQIAAAAGGRCTWSQRELMHIITRSDGKQFRINRQTLTDLNGAEFRRRYLDVPQPAGQETA